MEVEIGVALEERLCLSFQGSKKLWFSSKLMKIRFYWGRHENLGYRHEKRYQERLQDKSHDMGCPSVYVLLLLVDE